MRGNVRRISLVLAHIWVLSIVVNAQQPELSPAEKAGRKVFQTRCAMCHVGQDPATEMGLATGSGLPRRASTFGPVLRKWIPGNEEKTRDKIVNGGMRMPSYKLALSDEEVTQVIGYLKTVEQPLTKLAQARAGE